MQYQLLPDLAEDEFASLKADIAKRGVKVPVELDEQGNVLDGHHRIRACEELGLKDYPSIIRTGMTEDEKREHVLALNLERRHLSQDQKREVIARVLGGKPTASDREVARQVKADHHTVAAVRARMEESGEIPHFEEREDPRTGNLSQPVKRSVFSNTPRERAKALDLLETTGTQPPKDFATVADLSKAVRLQGAEQREADIKAKAEAFAGNDLLTLHHGTFQAVTESLEDASVDLVFTDPPYGLEFLPLWKDLGEVAARVLKPGGLLLAFAGKSHLLPCMNLLADSLEYYWTCAVGYENAKRTVWGVRFWGQWRPVLVYSNGTPNQHRYANDLEYLTQDKRPDQSLHPWAQADDAAAYYIERLSEPGDTILDPMCGTGSFVRAAAGLKRRAVGIEADRDRYEMCAGLCAEAVAL
jgi:SAM-dependent methyltransferase